MSTELELAKEQFARHVQRALSALYDPAPLSSSALIALLGIESGNDPAAVLRQILIETIESLKPDVPTPPGSRGWRVYQVLRRRYIEQLTQHEVAVNLGLSIRQLQREEKIAREVIAERLWTTHNVGAKRHLLATSVPLEEDQSHDLAIPSAEQELETLSQSTPAQVIQLGEVIQEVLTTLQPVLSASHTCIEFTDNAQLQPVSVKVPMLRQALFNIISVAAQFAADETLLVQVQHDIEKVYLSLKVIRHSALEDGSRANNDETLEMGRQLLEFCHAVLHVTTAGVLPADASLQSERPVPIFAVTAEFQIAQVFTVLVIDDNDDARQLLQRYLHGTPYQFVGAADARQALAIIEQLIPSAIVLDVMMPKLDGWTLIGQLRNIPRLQGVPIIVSTIVPQKDLAYALGAAEFIRKPIKRPELLAALARQLGQTTELMLSL